MLSVLKDRGSLQLPLPTDTTTTSSAVNNTRFIVFVTDHDSWLHFVTLPLPARNDPLQIHISELSATPKNLLKISVCTCELLYDDRRSVCLLKERLPTTIHERNDVPGSSGCRRVRRKSNSRNFALRGQFDSQCQSHCVCELLEVWIEQVMFCKVTAHWRTAASGPRPDIWLVTLAKVSSLCEAIVFAFVDGTESCVDLPVKLSPGMQYEVRVRALSLTAQKLNYNMPAYRMFGAHVVRFRAEFTKDDLSRLYTKAIDFCAYSTVIPCEWLYRNKSERYFMDIFEHRGGVMEVYPKDAGGDPASPINQRLSGLFFMAKNFSFSGRLPTMSAFGQCRLQVPAAIMFNDAPNLYFADFYCMRGSTHYITLVMTSSYTEADEFCAARLLPISLDDCVTNPFLFRKCCRNDMLYVTTCAKLEVEVLYTENIDVRELLLWYGARMTKVATFGKGSSTPGGVSKRADCPICNVKIPPCFSHIPIF